MAENKSERPLLGIIRMLIDITIVIVCIIVGFCTPRYLAADSTDQNVIHSKIGTPMKSAVSAELVTTNVIYELNQETNGIETIMLEILNSISGKLSFIIIPIESDYSMSPSLYQKLSAGNVTLPQTVRLSELYKYYGNDRAYEAGKLIISEMAGVNVHYYTGIPSDVFDSLFSKEIKSELESAFIINEQEAKQSISVYGSVKQYIKELVLNFKTDWSFVERLTYLDVYDNLKENDVFVLKTEGEVLNESFDIDLTNLSANVYRAMKSEQ